MAQLSTLSHKTFWVLFMSALFAVLPNAGYGALFLLGGGLCLATVSFIIRRRK
jgi:hypothetical protein